MPAPDVPRSAFRLRGGLWVLGQWLLMLATLAAGPWGAGSWSAPWSRPLAVILLGCGAAFGIAGVRALGPRRTTFPEPKPDAVLVRGGVYHFVRHPLYTSLILLSFSWALAWQSLPAVVLALATALFLDLKARQEERRLRRQFPEYEDYAAEVRRLLPWIY